MEQRIRELLNARLPASLGQSFIDSLAKDLAKELGGGSDNAEEFAKMKAKVNEQNFFINGGRVEGNTLYVYAQHPTFSDVQDDWQFKL